MPGDLRVTVAVVTYRRAERLAGLLPILLSHVAEVSGPGSGRLVDLLIVDNDPDRSAAGVTAPYGPPVRYEHEPRPGISAARNRALETAGADLMVFIDDDETPADHWLHALLTTQRLECADAVCGPVVSAPEGPVDPFVHAGGFHDRAHRAGLPTGTRLDRAATNNLLLDLRTVRRLGLRFDERFGLSGGEDSVFTGLLTRSGARLVWCAEATVTDHVPPGRLTREYVVQRTASLANASVLAEIALTTSRSERLRLVGRTGVIESVRALHGALLMVGARLTGSLAWSARGQRAWARSRGALTALAGRRAMAYARTSPV